MSYNNPIDPAKIDPRTGLYRLPDKKLFFNVQFESDRNIYLNLKKRKRFFGSEEISFKTLYLSDIPHRYRTIEEGLLAKSVELVREYEAMNERRLIRAKYEGNYPPRKLGSIT